MLLQLTLLAVLSLMTAASTGTKLSTFYMGIFIIPGRCLDFRLDAYAWESLRPTAPSLLSLLMANSSS